MSKKFELLKDLPDVEAGAIFELGADADAYYLTSDKTGTRFNTYAYPIDFVESHPKWFREIKEEPKRDWEVLEFWDNGGNILKWENGKWRNHLNSISEGNIFQLGMRINSVRRLSDNEVFTVGDEVEYREANAIDWNEVWGHGKINWIRLASVDKNKLETEIDDNHEWNKNYFPNKYLENIRHRFPAKEEPFVWNDSLVLEFARFTNTESNSFQGRYSDLDQFKQSKQHAKPDKERIEVTKIENGGFSDHGNWYRFHIAGNGGRYMFDIPKYKFPLIKEEIEKILNQ